MKQKYYGSSSGFTRLSMKIKYGCHGLIKRHASFYTNKTMCIEKLLVKIGSWGERKTQIIINLQ